LGFAKRKQKQRDPFVGYEVHRHEESDPSSQLKIFVSFFKDHKEPSYTFNKGSLVIKEKKLEDFLEDFPFLRTQKWRRCFSQSQLQAIVPVSFREIIAFQKRI
jgi:hypothetical protein